MDRARGRVRRIARGAVPLLTSCVLMLACGGPFLVFPGGALSGDIASSPVRDWSFATEYAFVDLEVRPSDPYSVALNYIVRDGDLYIDPKQGKRWFEYLREDPNVRVRFGDTVYPVVAVLVGRPGELDGFDADRFIYRLDSRPATPESR